MSEAIEYVRLHGSEQSSVSFGAHSPLHPEEEIDFVFVLRLPRSLHVGKDSFSRFISRAKYKALYSADQLDIDSIFAFANSFSLEVTRVEKAERLVFLRGSSAAVQKALQTKLCAVTVGGRRARSQIGPVFVPASLRAIVVAVLGLHECKQTSPRIRRNDSKSFMTERPVGFTGANLARIYGFPPNAGSGQCIALIEPGGGYRTEDIRSFTGNFGNGANSISTVSVLGATNSPGHDAEADLQVAADIQIVLGAAPESRVVAYFTANTELGFLAALWSAILDASHAPNIVSVSWGAPEYEWSEQALRVINEVFKAAALMGISVVCAADLGVGDGCNSIARPDVDFPASSAWVTACGGTSLVSSGNLYDELPWTGGVAIDVVRRNSISDVFESPFYQTDSFARKAVGVQRFRRIVPDVAAVADPQQGFAIFCHHAWHLIGGSGAVAPLIASFIARLNSFRKCSVGLLNVALYATAKTPNVVTATDDSKTFVLHEEWVLGMGWGPPRRVQLQSILDFLSSLDQLVI